MIDRRHIGFTTAPTRIAIDRWRVKLFCQAIGETNPVYWDDHVARQAGHRASPVPPTFLKAIETDHFTSAAIVEMLGVPLRSVLHAEQSYDYFGVVHVGDEIDVTRTIVDAYDKRDGALGFIVVATYFRHADALLCESRQTIVVRNSPNVAAA